MIMQWYISDSKDLPTMYGERFRLFGKLWLLFIHLFNHLVAQFFTDSQDKLF